MSDVVKALANLVLLVAVAAFLMVALGFAVRAVIEGFVIGWDLADRAVGP